MQVPHRSLLPLNFQHLRTFLASARVENFSIVGEQVGLSQSAVSRHIRAMEDSLGMRLFERFGRRRGADFRWKGSANTLGTAYAGGRHAAPVS